MLERSKTVLTVIDFQEKLIPSIHAADDVIARASTLIRCALELGLPILCTEQYPKGLGHTVGPIAGLLGSCAPMAKTSFGCLGDASFADALRATGRTQVLLTGVETHVCVLQTALGARALGLDVFVPMDAVGSRATSEHEAGLARMRDAGVTLVTTEMAVFEMLREAGTPEFKRILPLIK
ncbi:MAG: hypothetical protein AMXMBFR84_34110 [Candidatus Hydrogenedentota bacterium]